VQEAVWLYFVVSSDRQAETLEFQRSRLEEIVAANGWRVTRTFPDNPENGVSTGKCGARELLEALLTALELQPKAQRPQRVLMTRLDRMGRGIGLDSIAALAKIHKLGVIVHTLEDGDNVFNRASDVLKPVLRIFTGALENEARSDKSRAGHARRRAQGKHSSGHAPYGTVMIDGIASAYEPEAAIVRQIFERRLEGWGYNRLAKWAGKAAPAKRLTDGSLRKLRWGCSTVARLIGCTTLRGVVVDPEIFDRAQSIKGQSFIVNRITHWPWPLRGALRCTCGQMLTTAASGPKNNRIRYYTCRNVALHQRYPHHRADRLEERFAQLLQQIVTSPDLLTSYRSENDVDVDALVAQRHALVAEREQTRRRRARVWELAEDSAIAGSELVHRLEAIAAEEARLSGAIADVERHIDAARASNAHVDGAADVVAGLLELWPEAEERDQREVAKALAPLVEGLFVPPDAHEIVLGRDILIASANVHKSEQMRTFAEMLAVLAAAKAAARRLL